MQELPEFTRFNLAEPPAQNPELVEGMLRFGENMILSGKPKVGKTWLLMHLACAVATGGEWLGCRCGHGRVLYIDGELKPEASIQRLRKICDTYGFDYGEVMERVTLWNLRGKAAKLDDSLIGTIAERMGTKPVDLVVIDPAYKFLLGSENDQQDVTAFMASIDGVSQELGCAVAFAHHHSKGGKGDTAAMERMSGSSVWSRAPDSIVDVIELVPDEGTEEAAQLSDPHLSAWRVSATLRNLPYMPDFDILLDTRGGQVRHTRDREGNFRNLQPMSASRMAARARGRSREERARSTLETIEGELEQLMPLHPDGRIPTAEAMAACDYHDRPSFLKQIARSERFEVIVIGNNASYVVERDS